METNLFRTIFETTYTLSDLKRRIELVKTAATAKVYANNTQVFPISDEDKTWLDKNVNLEGVSEQNIAEITKELEIEAQHVQTLGLFLATRLPSLELEKIAKKVRADFGPLILEIKFDPILIAGCALAWKGLYKDYSLGKKIENQREKIQELVKKYLIKS